MNGIDRKRVADKYNNVREIWDLSDKWHVCTRKWIEEFIANSKQRVQLQSTSEILNAGSGGEDYGFEESKTIHMDIAEMRIARFPRKIVGSIEKINLENQCIDLALCVGSVINYCDPLSVIRELSRVLKKNGYLILEFENTYSLELLFKKSFNARRTLLKTFYQGEEEIIWTYAESFIKRHLALNNMSVIKISRCHILSPLIYRITKNSDYSSKFERYDRFMRQIPIVRKFSSNVIILAEKTETGN